MTIPQKLAREISQEICNFNTIRYKEKEPIMIYAKHLEELVQKVIDKYWDGIPGRAIQMPSADMEWRRGYNDCYDAFMAAFEAEEQSPKEDDLAKQGREFVESLDREQEQKECVNCKNLKAGQAVYVNMGFSQKPTCPQCGDEIKEFVSKPEQSSNVKKTPETLHKESICKDNSVNLNKSSEPNKKKVPEKLEDSIIRLNGAQRSLHLDELTALKVNEIIEFLSEEKS